ncbi:MAG TPA: 5-formyltetrahydrofolate cyclo-ligase [Chitinolyticbacter sp.]|nr:5-formyltetrahydrofolate cyclo-ligase [Chitinolyticbacter sp.]
MTLPLSPTEKTALRRELRARRAVLSADQHQIAAQAIARRVAGLRLVKPARSIAAYIATGSELSAWPVLLQALQRGSRVYLPRVPRRGRHLDFVRLDHAAQWQLGAYGIPEASHAEVITARKLDVVFVPLLGFDDTLARLGQGGGYYDSTFRFRRARRHWRRPLLVGIAFDEQRVDRLPVERWDLRLDLIVTPTTVYRVSS